MPMTGEFPSQRACNAENVSIWWHHHVSDATIVVCKYTPDDAYVDNHWFRFDTNPLPEPTLDVEEQTFVK